MRLALVGVRGLLYSISLTTMGIGLGCSGDNRQGPKPVPLDTVFIGVRFVEGFDSTIAPQMTNYTWRVDGARGGVQTYGGLWGVPGDRVVFRFESPFYQTIDSALVIPDSARGNAGSHGYYELTIRLQRTVPALVRAEWSADFIGPTIRIEVYAPNGLASVTLDPSVYYQACLQHFIEYPCDHIIAHSVGGATWTDPAAIGTRGWVTLSGPWYGWPDTLPPDGYNGMYDVHVWTAALNLRITDTFGHAGHGNCDIALIPSDLEELTCSALFTR